MRKPFIFNSILGIVSKKGAIEPATIERISESGKAFHQRHAAGAVKVAVAMSRSRRSALFVWNGSDTKQYADGLIASHASISAALNGYLAGGKKLMDILPALVSGGTAEISSKQGGVFTVFALDVERDIITASNTLHGTRPTLWANGVHTGVVGTSVTFVSLVANGFNYPEYNLAALADYLLNEQHSTYNTPFVGTHVLPVNSVVRVDETDIRCEPVDDALKVLCLSDATPTPRYFDDLSEVLVDSARSFADGTHYAHSLTGGRDSRLLLSALLHAGVDVSVQVNGFPEDADVILARRIAETMRVPMTYYETYAARSSFSTVEIQQYLWYYLRDTSGMSMNRPTQPADYRTHFFLNDSAQPIEHYQNYCGSMFSGLAGEMWRGGSFLIPSRSYLEGKTWLDKNEAERLLSTFGKSPYSFFLRAEFKTQFEDFFRDWVRINSDPNNYMRIFELIPIVHYYGMNHNFIDDIILLADNRVTRKIQEVGLQHRILERLAFEVIARLAPQLRDIPLENTRWAFEREGPYPGREDGWQARHPVPHAARHASNYAYYMVGVNSSFKKAVREMIFDSPGSAALFEIVDREAVEQIFRTPNILHWRWAWGAWNLAQGALVLSGALVPETPVPKDIAIQVRLDYPWAQAAYDLCTKFDNLDVRHAAGLAHLKVERTEPVAEAKCNQAATPAAQSRETMLLRSARYYLEPLFQLVRGYHKARLEIERAEPVAEAKSNQAATPAAQGRETKLLRSARYYLEPLFQLVRGYHDIPEEVWREYVAQMRLVPTVWVGPHEFRTVGDFMNAAPSTGRVISDGEASALVLRLTAAIRGGLGVEGRADLA